MVTGTDESHGHTTRDPDIRMHVAQLLVQRRLFKVVAVARSATPLTSVWAHFLDHQLQQLLI